MRQEYPRPQFVRDQWLSLNGRWQFGFVPETPLQIEVPFAYQCALSGIADKTPHDRLYYRRSFCLPADWQGSRILLHFGAVDYVCVVELNGHRVGSHQGGHTPFSLDITPFLTDGEQQLFVSVYDPMEDESIPRGKQFWETQPKFIWYTPTSGIWQSVWLEPVCEQHFASIRITPDIDAGTATLDWQLSPETQLPCRCQFAVTLGDTPVFSGEQTLYQHYGSLTIDIFGNRVLRGPFHFGGLCWSPDNPTLYDLQAVLLSSTGVCDQVALYFGMRKISVENGRICLNNKPYYQKLVLDQGYWSDGLLTAPTDEAFVLDIQRAKELGLNGCRKHEKVEDPRYLYWADKLGFLVWEGAPSFLSYSPQAATRFVQEWTEIIERDYNHPSIVVWGMLNESWGVPDICRDAAQQSFSRSLYHLAHSLDTTRLVIGNDGWEQTESDICALHCYRHGAQDDLPQQQRYRTGLQSLEGIRDQQLMEHLPYANGFGYGGQPVVLTEFGGLSCGEQADGWGYSAAADGTELATEYARLVEGIYDSPMLCGFCYTQLTDVEQEKNGLLAADRTYKCNPLLIRKTNDTMMTNR